MKGPRPWDNPTIRGFITEWLQQATPDVPPRWPGDTARWRYSEWGQPHCPEAGVRLTGNPNVAMERFEYLFTRMARKLHSKQHGTIMEYIERRLKGESGVAAVSDERRPTPAKPDRGSDEVPEMPEEYRKTLEEFNKQLDKSPAARLARLCEKVDRLVAEKRDAEALTAAEEAIEIVKSNPQAAAISPSYYATSLNNLAVVFDDHKRYADAEMLYLRAVTIIEKECKAEDQRKRGRIFKNLSNFYTKMGKTDEAKRIEGRARAIGAQDGP